MKQYSLEDILGMEQRFRTTFINSISGFKSLQMIGTVNDLGVSNLALFSSIFHVGANPPYLGFVVRPDGNQHETMSNILIKKHYTLNNVLESNFVAAHQTSARYIAGESEFKACGFTEEYIEDFKAPFVKEANIKIGLAFKEFLPFSLNKTKIVIGEVKHILIDEDLVSEDGFVDMQKAGSVTSAGLDAYYSANFLGRLSYAKPEKQPEFLEDNKY
jgi:flavin reductase (DIM6/NTAB) family NADH-FMN oxidoreductase RutF